MKQTTPGSQLVSSRDVMGLQVYGVVNPELDVEALAQVLVDIALGLDQDDGSVLLDADDLLAG